MPLSFVGPRFAGLTTLFLLAACSAERSPTAPEAEPEYLARTAFRLTIDVATGRISVAGPSGSRQSASAGGPSFSLIGDEALNLIASNCTWSAAPNPVKKRCSFDLALQNRLTITDLVPPTTFPKPPAGSNGILVFPFSAAALGVPGGTATASVDWDNPPANMFNDFAGCGGKADDCYRSETFPGALYAGETTAPRTVGFEVDKAAHTVAVYLVVAADLRDNPPQQTTIIGNAALCGGVEKNFATGDLNASAGSVIVVGPRDGQHTGRVVRGFCGFDLPEIRVEQATMRIFQEAVSGTPYVSGDVVIVDHLDYGATIDDADYDLAPIQADIGTLSADAFVEWKALDVTAAVQQDLASGRATTGFRLQFRNDAGVGSARFTGLTDLSGNPTANPPELQVTYRLK